MPSPFERQAIANPKEETLMPHRFFKKSAILPYWLILPAVICIILLATFVPDYFLGPPPVFSFPAPSTFIYALGIIALVGVAFRRAVPANQTATALSVWCGFYLLLGGLALLLRGLDADNEVIFKNRFYAITTILSVFFIAQDPRGRRVIAFGLMLVMVINLFFVGWDMAAPGTFSEVFGRAAGLFKNPTITGQGLVATMIAIWEELPKKWRSIIFLFVGIGTLATFSRGSIASWFFLWVGGWFVGLWTLKDNWKSQFFLISLLCLLFLCIQMGALEQSHWTALNENTLNRLRFGLGDESALERSQIARLAWQKISASPWWGHGLGMSLYASSQSTHNMHLTLWIDHGFMGLLVLPLLVWPLWKKGASSRLFFIYTLFFALFTHNLLDERNFLIPLAFLLSRPNSASFGNSLFHVFIDRCNHWGYARWAWNDTTWHCGHSSVKRVKSFHHPSSFSSTPPMA